MTNAAPNEDREWQELAAEWRATRPVPLEGLAGRVRQRNRRAAAVLAGDVALGVVALAVLAWLLSTGPTPLWLVWIAFMATATVALLTFSIRARAGTWTTTRPGTAGLIELSRRQTESSIRLARGTFVATLVILAFTAGWATFEAWQLDEPAAAEVRRRALVYGCALLYSIGWLVGCRLWIRRKNEELAWLERASVELPGTDGERHE